MPDKSSNLAKKVAGVNSEVPMSSDRSVPPGGEPRSSSALLPNFDFDTPDEESVQFLEEQWVRFCRAIGLTGEIPNIREAFEPKPATPPQRRRHWFLRPFFALKEWSDGPFDREER